MGYFPGAVPAGASATSTNDLTILRVPTNANGSYVTDTSNLTTYTFSSVPIGIATPGRYLLAFVGGDNLGANRTLDSVTCNGSSMTLVEHGGAGSDGVEGGAVLLKVTTGTTADFVVTWNGGMGDTYLAVFSVESGTGTLAVTGSDISTNTGLVIVSSQNGDVILGADIEAGPSSPSVLAEMAWTGSSNALTEAIDVVGVEIAYEAVTSTVSRTQATTPGSGNHVSIMLNLRAT